MPPQHVYPTVAPAPTEQPTVAPSILSTDQMIAQENARVFVFEHGAPEIEMPRQHRLMEFIEHHKPTLIVALVAIILMSSGGAFAFAKIQSLTKASKVPTSSVVASNESSTSAGGTEADTTSAADDSADTTDTTDTTDVADDSATDTSADDSVDINDTDTSAAELDASDVTDDSGGEDDSTPPPDDSGQPDTTVTPAPTPVPTTPSPVTAHKFTIGSWNSNADNKLVIGDQIKSIMGKTQILTLQEVHHTDQRASITSKVTCSSCAYAGYLPSYTSGTSSQSSYPIIWDKKYFSVVGSGSYRKMCDAAKTTKYSYAARYATWVKLQSKVNGKQFYVVDTHLMGVGESGGKPGSDTLLISRYKTHMTNLVALINELKSANVPIFVTGRFNVNYRYDRTVKTSYFPYMSFGAIGVRSNWDVMNLSGISSSAGTDGSSSRLIDYISLLTRSDVTPNSIAISTSTYGSGAHIPFLTTTIK